MSHTLQRSLNRTVAVLGVLLIVATVVVLAAYGGNGDGETTAQAGPAPSVDRIDIEDFLYAPEAVSVTVGTTLTFTNRDSAPHTATSGASPSADGTFETGTLKKDQQATVKLSTAGTFAYYCAIHPFMKGTVTVK